MNRREFVNGSLALAGAAALGNIGIAEEGTKKMGKKCMVVYFSWSGNTRFWQRKEEFARRNPVSAI